MFTPFQKKWNDIFLFGFNTQTKYVKIRVILIVLQTLIILRVISVIMTVFMMRLLEAKFV